MNYVEPYKKKAQSRLREIQILVGIAMKEREDWIRNKIRARWKLGKLPDGSFIANYSFASSFEVNRNAGYDKYYTFKNALNSVPGLGKVDLTLTGALGRGIKISSFNDKTEVYSTDEKFDDIVNKYGDYNFNITEEEENELFAYIYDEINTKMINYIYG